MSAPPPPPTDSGFHSSTDQNALEGLPTPFRDFIPLPTHPRILGITDHSALSWCESRRQIPAPAWLIERLDKKNVPAFIGFTSDGMVRSDVYKFSIDEGAPVEAMVQATLELLAALTPEELERVDCGGLDSDEFRMWSNPELYINPGGLRLDETTASVQDLVHAVLKASLSQEGYEKILGCCLTNEFLGELVNGRNVLNKHSYNFRLFETPSLSSPWGFSFFGHHLCIAVTIIGRRMVISPTFLAAEPDWIDVGPNEGLRLFKTEKKVALDLMVSLSLENQKAAQVYDTLLGMSDWNPFDERHIGGANQDNRVAPYVGCEIKNFTKEQKSQVMQIFEAYTDLLPTGPQAARLAQIASYIDSTWFCWYGKFGPEDAYYFRLHSPVAFIEWDYHCGIFLTNTSPSKCHVHTTSRLPNGGDYGKALIAQHEKEKTTV